MKYNDVLVLLKCQVRKLKQGIKVISSKIIQRKTFGIIIISLSLKPLDIKITLVNRREMLSIWIRHNIILSWNDLTRQIKSCMKGKQQRKWDFYECTWI